MADETPPPLLTLTPLNPEFREREQKMFATLRERFPVFRDDMAGTFVLSRFKDIREKVNDRTLWKGPEKSEDAAVLNKRLMEIRQIDPDDGELKFNSILLIDDPDHSRIRGPLAKALYARAAKCKPLVEEIVREKLDEAEGRGRFDVLDDYAIPIPIDVIGAILGVDIERRAQFRNWSEGTIQVLNPLRTPEQTAHMQSSSEAVSAYFLALMQARREVPQDDLITDMVQLQADGADLDDNELISNLIGLLVGGNLTTSDLIGNGTYTLLTHPDELAKLRADPGIINQVVEEILRFDPPVDITSRIAPRDMEAGGCPVKARQQMIMLLRAANRDPDVFDDPDAFNVSRKPAPHLAFGGGQHICIGAPLARIEAQASLGMLFARFPKLRLAENAKPPRRTLPFFNGYQHLDVIV